MNKEFLETAERILLERGFTDERGEHQWNAFEMQRMFGPDLAIWVWARHAGLDGLSVQAANPSDYESVCDLRTVDNESDLIAIIDALVSAFTIIEARTPVQSET